MHTVPVTLAHIPYCADIASRAFADAPHMRYLRPRGADFPERAYYFYLRRILQRYASPDAQLRVAVSDDSDPWYEEAAGAQVLGYAIWLRTWGEGESKEEVGEGMWSEDSLAKRVERLTRSWRDRYHDLVDPDPAEDSSRIKAFVSAGPQITSSLKAELDKQPKGKGHIFLQALAVDPALQKRGVGARLLKWGIERSEREAVPIALVASSKAKGLYDKFGWNSVTEVHVEGITWGDHVMFRWPEGKEEVEAEELVKIGRTEEVPLVEDLKLEEGA